MGLRVTVGVELAVEVAVWVVVSVGVEVVVKVAVDVGVDVAVLVGVGEGLAIVKAGPVALPFTLAPSAAVRDTPEAARLAVIDPVPEPVKLKIRV